MGHRLLDNRLLQHIMEGNITIADILDPATVEALPFPIGEPPIIIPPPMHRVENVSLSYVLNNVM
jgi:hypothetical protein